MIGIGDTVRWNDCGAKQIPGWKGFVGEVIGASDGSRCVRVKWQKPVQARTVSTAFLDLGAKRRRTRHER